MVVTPLTLGGLANRLTVPDSRQSPPTFQPIVTTSAIVAPAIHDSGSATPERHGAVGCHGYDRVCYGNDRGRTDHACVSVPDT